jgi:hypothetical protein
MIGLIKGHFKTQGAVSGSLRAGYTFLTFTPRPPILAPRSLFRFAYIHVTRSHALASSIHNIALVTIYGADFSYILVGLHFRGFKCLSFTLPAVFFYFSFQFYSSTADELRELIRQLAIMKFTQVQDHITMEFH